VLASIDVRLEVHAFIGNFAQFVEREHLIAAAIGKHRSIPVRELVYPTCFFNELVSWPKIKVICVA
jgi:hypothetical protein